jgi:DNA-binding IclR family transcriptional regulator
MDCAARIHRGHLDPPPHGAALPVMEHLCADVAETVVLQVIDGDQAVILAQVIGRHHVVRVEHNLIGRHPLHQGASGRVLLAFQPERAVGRALAGLPEGAADAVRAQFDDIRAKGFAVSHDELQWGVHAVSAPVLDASGTTIAALAVLAPVSRADVIEEQVEAVVDAARSVTTLMASSS